MEEIEKKKEKNCVIIEEMTAQITDRLCKMFPEIIDVKESKFILMQKDISGIIRKKMNQAG